MYQSGVEEAVLHWSGKSAEIITYIQKGASTYVSMLSVAQPFARGLGACPRNILKITYFVTESEGNFLTI